MDTKPWTGIRATVYSLIYRSPKTNALVVRSAGLSASDRVLDIGCGPGAAVRQAARIVVSGAAAGVDRSEPMIDIARRRSRRFPNTRFEVGSAESLPFPDGSFTAVWTAHSFHHWEDRAAGLAEMSRVLADGGRALILETDGKKHGLTDAGSAAVVADMERLGFREVVIDKVDKQVIISGVSGSPNLPI
jgi:ubiquinone/menaquinone biosynthesis C-methylase UbiE